MIYQACATRLVPVGCYFYSSSCGNSTFGGWTWLSGSNSLCYSGYLHSDVRTGSPWISYSRRIGYVGAAKYCRTLLHFQLRTYFSAPAHYPWAFLRSSQNLLRSNPSDPWSTWLIPTFLAPPYQTRACHYSWICQNLTWISRLNNFHSDKRSLEWGSTHKIFNLFFSVPPLEKLIIIKIIFSLKDRLLCLSFQIIFSFSIKVLIILSLDFVVLAATLGTCYSFPTLCETGFLELPASMKSSSSNFNSSYFSFFREKSRYSYSYFFK